MKKTLFIAFLSAACFMMQAQPPNITLYMPRNIHTAYLHETRSMDGKPGPQYWQNRGIYDISLSANPPDRHIKGTEKITYYNESPDTLNHPVIKLFLNIHRPGATRMSDASPDYLTGGIHIDALSIDGKQANWHDPEEHMTWQSIDLPKPLLPHDSVQLTFDWNYEISIKSSREGMLDSTSFYFAYFYPRVAVFDDCNGWDQMDFTDLQEFYSDFNDYTLRVTVPKNFIVWATGELVNPSEVLQAAALSRLVLSMKEDAIIPVASKEDLAKHSITSQNETNTWIWKASQISDMTCATSNHYLWDASSVVVDDAKNRRVSVQSAYKDEAEDFHHMVEFGRHALDYLSHQWPGVPYPFPKTTIVQGFADMEYPMMVNDNTSPSLPFSRLVVEHELAHSWFPFYMGINETRYGFMDEGWATTFEYLIGITDLGKEKAEDMYKQFRINGWIHDPSAEEDIPIMTPGNALTGIGLGNDEYGKPSLAYLALKDLLGDELFRKGLHEYIARWHGKHPIPWDFFNTFNDVSGENLNWFWNNWFFTNYYDDLTIEKVETRANGFSMQIRNIGGFATPVDIIISYEDGTKQTFHQTPSIWRKDQRLAMISINATKKIRRIELDGGIWMDADESNNSWLAP